jgi:hypothetical protein
VNKIELVTRLRHENRWPEAEKFKNTALAEFKAKGVKNASDAAWEAMAAQYPPLENPGDEAPEVPDATVGEPSPPTTAKMPAIPWKDLPDSKDINEDRLWAYNWAPICIDRTATGVNKINWDLASRPPSKGALMQMQAAASAPNAFVEAVNKALGARPEDEDDEANERKERKSIAEIEKILEAYGGVTCPKCGHKFERT